MRTRPMETNRAHSYLALATVAMLAMAVAAPGAAQAQDGPVANAPTGRAMIVAAIQKIDPGTIGTERDEGSPSNDELEQSTTAAVQSGDVTSDQATLIVGASRPAPEPEAWEGFRRSMAGAATSSCFGSEALPHRELAVQGLLRLPFLVLAAADGTCR